MRIASLGHLVFAATMIGLGAWGLIKADFPTIWQPVPRGLPAREALALLCACLSLATGVGLLWQRTAALAARTLLAFLLLWLVLLRMPGVLLHRTVDFWWAACKTAVMVAADWVLFVRFATDRDRQRLGFAAGDQGVRIARVLYGGALILFGVAHFAYLKQTYTLVPGWLPGPVAWSYFTGGTFIAAGVGMLAGVQARLAAALAALQIGLFTVLVWLPIIAAGATAYQWSEFGVSVTLTAGAWAVADSYRGTPWLAIGVR